MNKKATLHAYGQGQASFNLFKRNTRQFAHIKSHHDKIDRGNLGNCEQI